MYSVLFDIDGTLIDTGGAGKQAFSAAFHDLFQITEISPGVQFAGRSDRAIALDLMERHGIEPTADHWHEFVESYLSHLEKSLPACQGRVLPGVVPLLDHLQETGHVMLGLLTGNIKGGAARKLTQYGLADRFKFGGFGDVWHERNDIAKEAFEQSRFQARGRLQGIMVIGDTVHDVACARSIDAFAVAVATGGSSHEELRAAKPDLLLEDLAKADALLEAVGSRATA